MAVGIIPSLPFKGVHLLLGNGLTGKRVVVDPLLTIAPSVDQPPDPIEQDIPDLYLLVPSLGQWQRKPNRIMGCSSWNFDRSVLYWWDFQFSDNQTHFNTLRSNTRLSPSISNDQCHDQLSRSQLCKEQHSDPEIPSFLERALDENAMSHAPVCYVKNDMLIRKWHPPDVSADDAWTV